MNHPPTAAGTGYWRAFFFLWLLIGVYHLISSSSVLTKKLSHSIATLRLIQNSFCVRCLFCRLIAALRLISNLSGVHECAVEIKILDTDTEKTDSISSHRNAYLCVYACHWRLDCPSMVSSAHTSCVPLCQLVSALTFRVSTPKIMRNYVIWDNERHCPRTFHRLSSTSFAYLPLQCKYPSRMANAYSSSHRTQQ